MLPKTAELLDWSARELKALQGDPSNSQSLLQELTKQKELVADLSAKLRIEKEKAKELGRAYYVACVTGRIMPPDLRLAFEHRIEVLEDPDITDKTFAREMRDDLKLIRKELKRWK